MLDTGKRFNASHDDRSVLSIEFYIAGENTFQRFSTRDLRSLRMFCSAFSVHMKDLVRAEYFFSPLQYASEQWGHIRLFLPKATEGGRF